MFKDSNQSTVLLTVAAVGSVVAVAAGAWYLYRSIDKDDDDDKPALPDPALQLARRRLGTIMTTTPLTTRKPAGTTSAAAPTAAAPILPPRPTRSTPQGSIRQPASSEASASASTSTSTSTTTAPLPAAVETKLCANCNAECRQPLLRCSRCKLVYYCGPQCQRTAWQSHKDSCKQQSGGDSSNARSNGNRAGPGLPPRAGTSSRPIRAANTSAAAEARRSEANGVANGVASSEVAAAPLAGDEHAPQEAPQELTQEQLRQQLLGVLSGELPSSSSPLDQHFQDAVLLFIHGEYRTAARELTVVSEQAALAGRPGVQGDALRWLGHCYKQLVEIPKAVDAFERAHKIGVEHDIVKLQVDALSGLGCLYRTTDDIDKSVACHEQALEVADRCDGGEGRASVLTNLGASLSTRDPSRAAAILEEAVELREAQVMKIHEAGGEPAALARALMEHASALVNWASALMADSRVSDAESAFLQSLQVFEMIQDVDKVSKVLINLANLTELQNKEPDAPTRAALYREKLFEFAGQHLQRQPPSSCAICLEDLDVVAATKTAKDSPIVLGCFHCFHNRCWGQWTKDSNLCPECKVPVTLL